MGFCTFAMLLCTITCTCSSSGLADPHDSLSAYLRLKHICACMSCFPCMSIVLVLVCALQTWIPLDVLIGVCLDTSCLFFSCDWSLFNYCLKCSWSPILDLLILEFCGLCGYPMHPDTVLDVLATKHHQSPVTQYKVSCNWAILWNSPSDACFYPSCTDH